MAPPHRQHTDANSSNDKEKKQPPQDDDDTSQTDESQSADLDLNKNRSRTRKKYDHVTRKRVAEVRQVGACECRRRNVRCDHALRPEGPSTTTATFNQSQQIKPPISTSSSHTLCSEISSSDKDINSSYHSYNSTTGAKLGAIPYSLQQYLNQRRKDSPINEVLFEKYQVDEVAWQDLACVRQSCLVWTDGKRSVAKDSGIDMGPESSAGAIEERDGKRSVAGDSGIGIGPGLSARAMEERNTKLDAYLPQDQTNEDLMVFTGGPRRRLQHENSPFYWKTGLEQTRPPRLKQPKFPQTQPQAESIGTGTQNTMIPSPLQIQQNSSGSHGSVSPGHVQTPSLPISQFGSLPVQNYGSPTALPDQIFGPPSNQAYASPSPQSMYQPFHNIALVQGYYESMTYPHTTFYQQADLATTTTNVPQWIEDFGGSNPLAIQPERHAAISAGGLHTPPIIEQPTLAPYFETFWLAGVQCDPAEGPPPHDTWNNQELSPFDVCAHRFDGPNDSTRNGYHNTMSPPQISRPYPDLLLVENDFTHMSGRQGTSPLSQPSSQDDGTYSTPSLSFGHSSAETASNLLNTPSNQGGMDSAFYRPSTPASRPAYSVPLTDLNGVAAAMPESPRKMPPEVPLKDGDLTKYLLGDDSWMEDFLSMPE